LAKKVVSEVKKQIVALVTAAFGFVAALQWNEAIKKLLEPLTAGKAGTAEYVGVAILVTIIAVVVIIAISKIFGK
jgi:hypothetical protein